MKTNGDRVDARVVFQGELAKQLREATTAKYGGIKGSVNFFIRQAVKEKLERENSQKASVS